MMERITFGYLITAVMLILPAIVFVLMIRPTFSTASLRLSLCGLLTSMIPNIMGSLLRRNEMRLGRQSPAGRKKAFSLGVYLDSRT
jgi:hypothetical protein